MNMNVDVHFNFELNGMLNKETKRLKLKTYQRGVVVFIF